MTATLHKVGTYIQKPKNSPHIFKKGRSAKYEIPDVIHDGFAQMIVATDLCTIPDNEVSVRDVHAAATDVGVN
jgi:hypothetical protein